MLVKCAVWIGSLWVEQAECSGSSVAQLYAKHFGKDWQSTWSVGQSVKTFKNIKKHSKTLKNIQKH